MIRGISVIQLAKEGAYTEGKSTSQTKKRGLWWGEKPARRIGLENIVIDIANRIILLWN